MGRRTVIPPTLPEVLARVRKHRNLTQQKVADRMGTSRSAVSRFESGKYKISPTLDTVNRYAAAVGADIIVHLKDM
jgi:transcriptional regulator with XRE-family HTH domain